MPETDSVIYALIASLILFGVVYTIILKIKENRDSFKPFSRDSTEQKPRKQSKFIKILLILGIAQKKKPTIDKRVYPSKTEIKNRLANGQCVNCTTEIPNDDKTKKYILCNDCSQKLPKEIQIKLFGIAKLTRNEFL